MDDEMFDHVTHLNDDETENVDSSNLTTQQNRKVSSRTLRIQYYSPKFFSIYQTSITEESAEFLSKLIHSGIKKITINRCKLTARIFEKLSTLASNSQCQIRLYDVTIIFTDDEMSDHVTHLNDDEIESVDKVSFQTLKIYLYDLKELSVYKTNIHDDSGELLSKLIISETKKIKIRGCTLSAGGLKKVLTQALNSKCPISLLNVTIIFTDDEISDHVTHLNDDEIENVDCSNSTTQQNRKVSSRTLKIFHYDLKELYLEDSDIDDESVEVLSKLINDRLETFVLYRCNLTPGQLKKILTLVSNSKCLLQKLSVNKTEIDDESAEVLSNFIDDRLEDIELINCNLTSRGIEKVSTRLSSLACPLPILNIENNNIGDSGFRSVAACVDKITFQLNIGSTDDEDLTLDGVKAIIEKIKFSPFQMEFLFMYCPDKMKSAVRRELLELKNIVDRVELNRENAYEDRSRCSIM